MQASAPEAEEAAALPAQTPVSHRRGVYNILLCGTDGDGLRTDTIMLGHLDKHSGTAALLSIPRDTPLLTEDGRLQKLNAVYAGGGHAGMRRLKKEVGRLLGFEPDGYVLIDLDAFRRTVDLLGGVWFDVPQDMDYSDPRAGAGDPFGGRKAVAERGRGHAARALPQRLRDAGHSPHRGAAAASASAGAAVPFGENLPKLLPVVRVFYEETLSDLTTGNLIYLAAKLCRCDLGSLTCCTLQGEGVTVGGVSYYPLYAGKLLETVNRSIQSLRRAGHGGPRQRRYAGGCAGKGKYTDKNAAASGRDGAGGVYRTEKYTAAERPGALGRMNGQKKGRNNMRTAKEVAAIAAKALDSKKGIDLRLIEISDISTLADYFLICTASSNTHVRTLCDAVEEAMDKAGEPMVGREGHRGGTWVVLDFGCVVVHVFTEETRAFYDLERLWQDGKQVSMISLLNEG